MGVSKIEWTEKTWNPTVGCTRISEGCRNCYAMLSARRVAVEALRRPVERRTAVQHAYLRVLRLDAKSNPLPSWNGNVELIPSRLEEPMSWREPSMVFVDSMSDLFHESIPDDFITRVFATMALCPRHTFQVLTKRAERMSAFTNSPTFMQTVAYQAGLLAASLAPDLLLAGHRAVSGWSDGVGWPLPNVWLGVSVEDQATADERIPHLLRTVAAVTFVSAEPLLGPVMIFDRGCPHPIQTPIGERMRGNAGVDWVIVGGESGNDARPFEVSWARSIVKQCRETETPCFVKQLGARPFDPLMVGPSPPADLWPDGTRFETRPRGADAVWQSTGFVKLADRKGGDIEEWPEELRVREWPQEVSSGD